MSEYFPKANSLGGNIKAELDLSNYATKTDLINAAGVDALSFATDLTSLKSDVDKSDIDKIKNVLSGLGNLKRPSGLSNLKSKEDKPDIDKLAPVPVDVSKLSVVVKKMSLKNVYNAKIKNIEVKRLNITNLATNASLNSKINEIKGEITTIISIIF